MTNYTKTQNYSPKDALVTGDPLKKVLGSDFDAEMDLIVTAIASKFQSSDIASQAQAVAGVSNTTLMTPLRVAQALAGSGAGMLGDISALADPNADRGLFWDDSADAVALFDLGTGLNFTGTTLGLTLGSIDHNSLLNWVANKHIDHSAVTISTSNGITGGGDITASRTLSLDVNGLTLDSSPDVNADFVPTYDTSAATNKKVLMSSISGVALGDGRWYRNTAQSISAGVSTTLIYDTQVYNTLSRGSYSTSTGLYTAGASGARLYFSATFTVASLAAARSMTIIASQSVGGEVARASHTTIGGTETQPTVIVCAAVSLAAGETFSVAGFVTTTANATVANSLGSYNVLSIMELA